MRAGPFCVAGLTAYDRRMGDQLPDWAGGAFTLETVDLNGESIPCLVGGRGDPLLMIHGLSASLDWWRFNAPALAEHFRVYLIDLPGFGRLGHLDQADSMPEYMEWVRGWMDAVGLERVHLIGHSMGGHVSIRLAARHPERVHRLVLVAPAGALPETTFPKYLAPVLKTIQQIPGDLLPMAIRDIRRANLRTTFRSGRDLLEHDVLDLLPRIRARTLIIWGRDDQMVPSELAGAFVERIPDAELRLLEGAGHILMVDEPERFNQWVLAFLTGDPRSGE